jgi:hypothetical protein
MIAHSATVDLHFVEAECRYVGASGCDRAIERELGAEQGTWIRFRRVFDEIGGDPLRLPLRGAHQPCFEERWRAPLGCPSVRAPCAHLPVIALARRERGTGVWPIHRLVGRDFAGAPQGRAREIVRTLGDANLVGALHRPTPIGMQHPAEPRCRLVDADRVDRVFSAESLQMERLAVRNGSREREQR